MTKYERRFIDDQNANVVVNENNNIIVVNFRVGHTSIFKADVGEVLLLRMNKTILCEKCWLWEEQILLRTIFSKELYGVVGLPASLLP